MSSPTIARTAGPKHSHVLRIYPTFTQSIIRVEQDGSGDPQQIDLFRSAIDSSIIVDYDDGHETPINYLPMENDFQPGRHIDFELSTPISDEASNFLKGGIFERREGDTYFYHNRESDLLASIKDPTIALQRGSRQPKILIDLQEKGKGATLSYLHREVTWRPRYKVVIDGDIVDISLQAIFDRSYDSRAWSFPEDGKIYLVAGVFDLPGSVRSPPMLMARAEEAAPSAEFSEHKIYSLPLRTNLGFVHNLEKYSYPNAGLYYVHNTSTSGVKKVATLIAQDYMPRGEALIMIKDRSINFPGGVPNFQGASQIKETLAGDDFDIVINQPSDVQARTDLQVSDRQIETPTHEMATGEETEVAGEEIPKISRGDQSSISENEGETTTVTRSTITGKTSIVNGRRNDIALRVDFPTRSMRVVSSSPPGELKKGNLEFTLTAPSGQSSFDFTIELER